MSQKQFSSMQNTIAIYIYKDLEYFLYNLGNREERKLR